MPSVTSSPKRARLLRTCCCRGSCVQSASYADTRFPQLTFLPWLVPHVLRQFSCSFIYLLAFTSRWCWIYLTLQTAAAAAAAISSHGLSPYESNSHRCCVAAAGSTVASRFLPTTQPTGADFANSKRSIVHLLRADCRYRTRSFLTKKPAKIVLLLLLLLLSHLLAAVPGMYHVSTVRLLCRLRFSSRLAEHVRKHDLVSSRAHSSFIVVEASFGTLNRDPSSIVHYFLYLLVHSS